MYQLLWWRNGLLCLAVYYSKVAVEKAQAHKGGFILKVA